MARCRYVDSCPFPNDKLVNMPATTNFMAENYCYWNFARCGIYKTAVGHGIPNVYHEASADAECCLSDKVLNWLICGRIEW